MDLSKLLEPISDEQPTGVDLRFASGDDTIGHIKECRTEIRPEEDPARAGGRSADWRAVRSESQKALEKQTKDLELAAYLTEGWIHDVPIKDREINRNAGIFGLTNGLRLIHGLMSRYWDTLHPGYDEGEIIFPIRSRHLSWIGGTATFLQSVSSAQLVPVTAGTTVTLQELKQAEWLEEIRATQNESYESLAKGKRSLEEIRGVMSRFSPEAIDQACSSIQAAETALAELQQLCDKLIPEEDAPNFLPLRDLLEEAAAFVKGYASDVGEDLPTDTAGDDPLVQGESGRGGGGRSGPLASRADALRRLSEVADYFRRTEPHSPVSYLVQRAMRWGEMPFEQLLQEVVKDGAARQQVWDLLGIKPPEEME